MKNTLVSALRNTLLAALCGSLVACTHTPVSHYYVLSAAADPASQSQRSAPRIGLGPVTLPEYLDRPQIVTRAAGNRLELSNVHRWAEPLQASFVRALLANLERELPKADIVVHPWRRSLTIAQQIQIEITRFDRDADGAFHLSARWRVSKPGEQDMTATQRSDIEIPLTAKADDYDALLTAANSAVAALAARLAAQLQTQ